MMNIKSSILFAKRLIFPRTDKSSTARKSVLASIVCIAISVIPLVMVKNVSDGMFSGMTERIITLSTDYIEAVFNRQSESVRTYENFKKVSDELLKEEGISKVYPQIESSSLAFTKDYRTGAQIRAVEPEIFSENESFKNLLQTKDGSVEDFKSGERNCIIGEKIASLLNVKPGDTIRLISQKRIMPFKVEAVVSSGYQELDAVWVFIPLDVSYSFLQRESSFHSVMITPLDKSMNEIIRLKSRLNDSYLGRIRFYSWDEVNSSQFENFSSTKIMLVFIMFLIVLVASVNISSALVMLVMERRKEIAILKSLGASSEGITFSFLITGGFCGFSGTLIGIPIGLLCSLCVNSIISGIEKFLNGALHFFNIISGNSSPAEKITLMNPAYYLQEIPVQISFESVFFIALLVIFLSLLVSIIPSVKAGKERPMEIFRKV